MFAAHGLYAMQIYAEKHELYDKLSAHNANLYCYYPTCAAQPAMNQTIILTPGLPVYHTPAHVPHNADHAYEYCRDITYSFAKTFYFASYFLRNEKKRSACYAIYAFCRFIDEITDHAEQLAKDNYSDAVRLALNEWENDLDAVYSGAPSAHPVLIAWADVLERYHIPPGLPKELIEGCLMDTYLTRYNSFDDLYTYCYKVASVVGLMTSEVFGYSSKDALPHAIDLGIAMQLTNIARDVAEDADRGRIYLPTEELEMFGVYEQDILDHEFTGEMEYYMRYYTQRAHRYYESADKGISYLDRDSRLTVQLMSTNYRRILNRLSKQNYNPFAGRARLNTMQKAAGAFSAWRTVKAMA
ncbi:MAG: phytoene/squalene synthase family protein [Candidatus Kapabacteria bacterium]|nr:phytoene/squalene synthase family protein [Candidatus Kapabacteria bacterium]